MNADERSLTEHLLARLAQVRRDAGMDFEKAVSRDDAFADILDSMGLVEFLAIVAADCGVEPKALEEAVAHRFTTVAELVRSMHQAGIGPKSSRQSAASDTVKPHARGNESTPSTGASWLAATAVRLPNTIQGAGSINALLHRPPGWFENHAGIQGRRLWSGQDPLAAAAEAGGECLAQARLQTKEVGALLVTSEAPPLLAGLAADLHHRLGLPSETVALEVGGACTGFLAALWLARALLPRTGPVLVTAVEAPSHYLTLKPGAAGENAALFGDGAAASLISDRPLDGASVALIEVILGAEGGAGKLLQVQHTAAGLAALSMDGGGLASRAIRTMARGLRRLVSGHGLELSQLAGVVIHGGNGRLPGLLARQLGLPSEKVWSETPTTGNLGAASLPVAWKARQPAPDGPVAWAAVGAGLTWGVALTTPYEF